MNMSWEPSSTGHAVYIVDQSGEAGRLESVVAWAPETGDALVVDNKQGRLIPARDAYSNFHSVQSTYGAVVSTIQAPDGWRLLWSQRDGTFTATPLLAWLITSCGSHIPFAQGEDGEGPQAWHLDFLTACAPDQDPTKMVNPLTSENFTGQRHIE
ncbi:hypothetical protein ADK76_37925 [Streptomyces griseoflavus]|uniref:hypothetical protein n=1 Tax=Streptomyces rimosus TaxID=1927 RepID=UPI0004CB9916|nr:hypothetical protein [Streptomyces rimosus]KOG51002.1 hypothetical protein ADK76_37925 [Streptomyces griseoflavus]